jgi:aldehyde reductase
MLIHWPGKGGADPDSVSNVEARDGSWQDLEEMYSKAGMFARVHTPRTDAGKLRAIGVSNYEVSHLEALLKVARVHPVVNQCELHPFYPNRAVADYCHKHNIHMQAYSSLGGHTGVGQLITNTTVSACVRVRVHTQVVRIAGEHSCTPAQVLYAYALCQGFSVLPRTTNMTRVIENAKSVDVHLSDKEVHELTALGETDEKKF